MNDLMKSMQERFTVQLFPAREYEEEEQSETENEQNERK